MTTYWMTITLQSDTALGRGDGVAGLVNAEVQHDASGLPYLGGKTLKGLLAATGGELHYALEQSGALETWEAGIGRLFGRPGSRREKEAILHVGDARLPADLRAAVAEEIDDGTLTREMVLDSLTTIRRQTAMDAVTGAPQRETLRTIRVVLREITLAARLVFLVEPTTTDKALLAACVKGLRRVGSNRNRGLGRVVCRLYADEELTTEVTDDLFADFRTKVAAL